MPAVMNMNNPAGRLRFWIHAFETQFKPNEVVAYAAAELMHTDRHSFDGEVAFMRVGIELADLCKEVRAEMDAVLDSFSAVLLSDFDQVEKFVTKLGLARQSQISTLLDNLDAAGHRGLEYLDEYLALHRPQNWLDDHTRDDLADRIRELIALVGVNEDLDNDTKTFASARLNDVLAAFRNAHLTGTAGIERSTDALIGSFHREPNKWQRVWEQALGGLLAGLVLDLVFSFGATPTPHMLPPAAPAPVVQIENNVTNNYEESGESEGDVVDGELVEDEQDGPPPPSR